MAPPSPRLVVLVDVKKKPWEQKRPLHNRWHPRIPPVAEVTEGEVFCVQMMDSTEGTVADNDSASDIKYLHLTTAFFLSPIEGPFSVLVVGCFLAGRREYFIPILIEQEGSRRRFSRDLAV
ncbi:hypothetical protein KSP40_PGU000816 [Platanthera guangdongensis]|uniref:Uncharacterized protein n=1 Tax=Platanthera guangdongensis TaxID=2320717 RepID=A0ABR2MD28_9ASPA